MATLLKGVAQGARGLFASDEDEDELDADLEALLVRLTLAHSPRSPRAPGRDCLDALFLARSDWTVVCRTTAGATRFLS